MSALGEIEETVVEKEVEEPDFIPRVIRRLSAIDTLVNEARYFSRRNTITSDSSGDSLPDLERRESNQDPNRRHSLGVDSLQPIATIEDYRRKRRKTLHKIEPIAENSADEMSKF